MLKGNLTYREDGKEVKFEVTAKDSFNDFKMQLDLDYSDRKAFIFGQYLLDKELIETGSMKLPIGKDMSIEDLQKHPAYTLVRRLELKKSNKYKSNIMNRDFCSKICALLRWVEIEGAIGRRDSTEEVTEFSSERVNAIDGIGTVTYNMGMITEMHINAPYVQLDLITIDDKMVSEALFKDLKEKDKFGNLLSATPVVNIGFKLNEDLLGFPYESPLTQESSNVFGLYSNIEDVIYAHPDKNTNWILNRKYVIVTDDMLEDVIKMFMEHKGVIAFDTETTGLRINFKSRTGEADELVGCVLSCEVGTGYYFPLQHKLFKNLCDGDHHYFMEKYMRPILEGKKIICHNISFDWKVAYIYDINVNCVFDTMLAFGVTKRYEEESFEMGLKALAHNILGLDMFDLNDFIIGGDFGSNEITFADLPYELVRRYAPADADMTLSLYEYIVDTDMISKYGASIIFDMEVWFAKAVAYSEFYGYHIDAERIPALTKDVEEQMKMHSDAMFKLAGHEFNPNSAQQLATVMYDELGIEQIGDSRSTNKETLKTLSLYTNEKGEPKYPFVVELKAYRDVASTYKNFIKKLGLYATSDGYIFPETQQLGTNTGRLSIKNPNYQSYDDVVKHYVTPRPGFMHFDSDFAQIEQRVLTSYACIMFPNEEPLALMKDFDDPDMDYHQYQAARMFNVPYAAVTKSMRQQSKGVNFGLPYGMGDSSLGARIFGERNATTKAKAAQLRKKFFQGQELIERFFQTVRDRGVQNGYTVTQFGRRRYYHRSKFTEAEIRRQAGNHVIQGCLGGDTRIQTKEYGIVKIKDVVGQHLHVWDGDKWSNGDITYSGKKQKCIITFSNGQKFICSPIHKFLEANTNASDERNYIMCKNLVVGDEIAVNLNSGLRVNMTEADKKKYEEFYSNNSQVKNSVNPLLLIDFKVESVEITDDYIDMYDVCNTDGGYYVADGVITHNTAADIYKIAVVNLFKRVCREGWLGKVLFNAFVHDEIVIEVSKSINPYYFMKVWREEFEVKPENYCKLYAGAGVGCCWYDAKKLDLPPDYIDEIIAQYTEGMSWDGDTDKFISDIKAGFARFKTNKVKKYLEDPEHLGVIIKPAIWALLPDEVSKIVSDIQRTPEVVSEYNYLLGVNIPTEGDFKTKDLQEMLKIFCRYHGVDYDKIDIKDPGEVEVDKDSEEDVTVEPLSFDDTNLANSIFHFIIGNNGWFIDFNSTTFYMVDICLNNNFISSKIYNEGLFFKRAPLNSNDFKVVQVRKDAETGKIYFNDTGLVVQRANLDSIEEGFKYWCSQGGQYAL